MSRLKLQREGGAMPGAGDKGYSAKAYIEFLKTKPDPGLVFEGITKLSDDDEEILFAAKGDCSKWTPIPLDQVERIEHLGWSACGTHRHPVARIALKAPEDAQGATFARLALLHHDVAAAKTFSADAGLTCPPGQRPCFDVNTGRWTCCPT